MTCVAPAIKPSSVPESMRVLSTRPAATLCRSPPPCSLRRPEAGDRPDDRPRDVRELVDLDVLVDRMCALKAGRSEHHARDVALAEQPHISPKRHPDRLD